MKLLCVELITPEIDDCSQVYHLVCNQPHSQLGILPSMVWKMSKLSLKLLRF